MPKKDIAVVVIMSLAALGLRLLFFGQSNEDLRLFLLPWYGYINAHGGFSALADAFSNYSPPYTYFLVLLSYLPGLPAVTGIKLISVLFDYGLALGLAWIVRRQAGAQAGWRAYLACLVSPVVFLDSAAWGQCDGIYTLFLVLCLVSFLRGKPGWGMAFISIAFTFKAQTIFLGAAALVMLVIKFKWKYLLIPPLAFTALMIPALAAGRGFMSILTVYPEQTGSYDQLSMNAPNLYTLIPNDLYDIVVPAGILLTILAGLGLVGISLLRRSRLDATGLVLLAVFSLLLFPSILPKMHERYFYPAALFSLLLPIYVRRLWPVTMLLQVTTPLAFLPFLYNYILLSLPELALLNLVALVLLGIAYVRYLYLPVPNLNPGVKLA